MFKYHSYFFFACADDDKLDAALDQALGDVAQQINALVPDEARDHGQNSYVTVLRQADALLEGKLVCDFPPREASLQ